MLFVTKTICETFLVFPLSSTDLVSCLCSVIGLNIQNCINRWAQLIYSILSKDEKTLAAKALNTLFQIEKGMSWEIIKGTATKKKHKFQMDSSVITSGYPKFSHEIFLRPPCLAFSCCFFSQPDVNMMWESHRRKKKENKHLSTPPAGEAPGSSHAGAPCHRAPQPNNPSHSAHSPHSAGGWDSAQTGPSHPAPHENSHGGQVTEARGI